MGGQCPTDDSCHTHPPAYTAGSVGVPCTRRTHHTHTRRPPTTWQTQTHCIAMHVTCRSAGPGETANAPPLRAAGGHATQAASSTASPRHRHTHTRLLPFFSSSSSPHLCIIRTRSHIHSHPPIAGRLPQKPELQPCAQEPPFCMLAVGRTTPPALGRPV